MEIHAFNIIFGFEDSIFHLLMHQTFLFFFISIYKAKHIITKAADNALPPPFFHHIKELKSKEVIPLRKSLVLRKNDLIVIEKKKSNRVILSGWVRVPNFFHEIKFNFKKKCKYWSVENKKKKIKLTNRF